MNNRNNNAPVEQPTFSSEENPEGIVPTPTPSAPPFETYEEYMRCIEARMKYYAPKDLPLNLSPADATNSMYYYATTGSPSPFSLSETATNSLTTTEPPTTPTENPHKTTVKSHHGTKKKNLNLSLNQVKKKLQEMMEMEKRNEKNHSEHVIKLLKYADKLGLLPLVWQSDSKNFDQYLSQKINLECERIRKECEPTYNIPTIDGGKTYFELPFLNLENAFLKEVNMKHFYLAKVNFKNADLTNTFIYSTCINVQGLMAAKSIRGMRINSDVILISEPPPTTWFTSPVKIKKLINSKSKQKKLADKTVEDYQHFFSTCNDAERIKSVLAILNEMNVRNYSIVSYTARPFSLPLAPLPPTFAYQKIVAAGKKRISELNPKTNDNDMEDYNALRIAYHG